MTKRTALRLTGLRLRRAPGFKDGGFALDGLCGGVNLIYGPNASGKTTLARAIRRLLWPDRHDRDMSLTGEFDLEEARWLVDFDAGRCRAQRNGVECDPFQQVSVEAQDRYTLALHELLVDENGAFAEAIQRESAGGYDLAAAAEAVWPRVPRPQKLLQELQRVQGEHRSARQQQQALWERESELQELRRRREQLDGARVQQQLVERALRWVSASEALRDAERQLESFPRALAKFRGDEPRRWEEFRVQEDELQRRVDTHAHQLRAKLEQLEQVRLADDGTLGTRVKVLAERGRVMGDMVRTQREQQQAYDQAAAALEEAERRLGKSARPEQLERLDVDAIEQLFELVRRDEQLRAKGRAEEILLEWLGSAVEPGDMELARRGVECLQDWLARADGSAARQSLRWLAGLAGGLIAVQAIVLALSVHGAWLALLPCGVGVVVWSLWWGTRGGATQELRERYERLGLQPPIAWDRDGVRERVDVLQQQVGRWTVEVVKRERWDHLRPEIEELDEARRTLARECADLAEQIGLDPQEPVATLAVRAESLHHWLRARMRWSEAAVARDAAVRDCEVLAELLNGELAGQGYAAVLDGVELATNIRDLEQRYATWQEAKLTVRQMREQGAMYEEQMASLRRQRETWLGELEMSGVEETEFLELARRHTDYVQAVRGVDYARREAEVADEALAEHPGWKEETAETLRQRELDTTRLEEESIALSEEIGAIEEAVREAKRKGSIEDLMAAEQALRDELRQVRAKKAREAVGGVIEEFVQRESQQRDRPAVFERARALFARITHGRYELEVDGRPAFRAVDTATKVGHALDELSSGTRLQLLLAVRVAFVEEQEPGPCLPLVLDETLGNSDEQRAGEMIDAAIEICRTGRQLFYLTAQQDEVAKWKARLDEQGDVAYRLIDLAERRGFSERERLPALPPAAPVPAVAAPGELDHAAYRQRLNVAGFDPRRDVGATHLWYLVHDSQELYALLCRGINTWGQWQTLARSRSIEMEQHAGALSVAEGLAKALCAYVEAWRIGRGRAVDRSVLLESGVVTDAFMDAVFDLAGEVGGDARRLIEALEGRGVKNFRASATAGLKEYLLEQGYLDTADVLETDAVRVHVLKRVMAELDRGHVTAGQIDYLLALVDERFGDERPPRRRTAASGALF